MGIESNCHSLLLQGWKGMWIEGFTSYYKQIMCRFAPIIREGRLRELNEMISVDNIDGIIKKYAENEELDLLSIDTDGNDWHVWKAKVSIRPRAVVIKYNGKLTPEIDYVMPYNKDHKWDHSDRFGASLKALERLGREKGYQLVGTDLCGINAFFVRQDLAKDFFALPATAENLYNPARMNTIIYQNGHPARNYIGTDVEGMEGVFEYYPDWKIIP